MSTKAPLPILLGGPSGIGKSSLGHNLNTRGWLHCEADRPGSDGVDDLNLRVVWDTFYNHRNPEPLARELERQRARANCVRVVLTLPSIPLTPEHLARSNGVMLIRFLTGPGWACLRNFTLRKSVDGKMLGEAHWCQHNWKILDALNSPTYALHRLEAIDADGKGVASDVLAQNLFDQSR